MAEVKTGGPPEWTLGKNSVTLWAEDECTLHDPDRENMDRAWRRLFGSDGPKGAPLETWDAGDATYTLYPGWIVEVSSYPGNNQIRRLSGDVCLRTPHGPSPLLPRGSKSSDPNISQLRGISNPSDYGTLLRLATVMELLNIEESNKFHSLWDYLTKKMNFASSFVETTAKAYWRMSCKVVDEIPYKRVVLQRGCQSEWRLMSYFLREVCAVFASESGGGGAGPLPMLPREGGS